ncbi:polysaccharide deacetylase family protein [Bradyrhizobium canariense]|uniref:Chitooligosaccharide deacetylase n=1 Tax=Bradyrhizobium canariense TaxID=255045 RepID=A0A1H1NXM5_9BRAD|nr:polysaccharide deacetylase family protein [Bradyrhizobium canariense]SDS03550.1 Peptidoglycan/xylan/chitin deacetylase, PgdA/CDA1 family [Bradyrhizobium canariense]
MKNIQRLKSTPKLMSALGAGLVVSMAWTVAAQAADCPRKDALGTSRILAVDAATTPRVGLKSFPDTLPLEDHEVVLTFDDGPWPATTPKVLAALAHECVHATFFLIGKPASEHPDLVRRIAAEGHTVGTHTWTHFSLAQIKPGEAVEQIDHGISAVKAALNSDGVTRPLAPFFRFPGFESTPATLDLLQSRGIVVFGADLWASDWNPMTPAEELKLLTDRLNAAGKGIILLHDPKGHTAAMLPAFLRYLKENHYSVVHVVPATPRTGVARAP